MVLLILLSIVVAKYHTFASSFMMAGAPDLSLCGIFPTQHNTTQQPFLVVLCCVHNTTQQDLKISPVLSGVVRFKQQALTNSPVLCERHLRFTQRVVTQHLKQQEGHILSKTLVIHAYARTVYVLYYSIIIIIVLMQAGQAS